MRSQDALAAQRMLDGNDPVRPFSVEFCDGIEMRAMTDVLLRLGCKVSAPPFGLRATVTPPAIRPMLQPAESPKAPKVRTHESSVDDKNRH